MAELAARHKTDYSRAVTDEFKNRQPHAFAEWDNARKITIQRSRRPSLGR